MEGGHHAWFLAGQCTSVDTIDTSVPRPSTAKWYDGNGRTAEFQKPWTPFLRCLTALIHTPTTTNRFAAWYTFKECHTVWTVLLNARTLKLHEPSFTLTPREVFVLRHVQPLRATDDFLSSQKYLAQRLNELGHLNIESPLCGVLGTSCAVKDSPSPCQCCRML